MPEFWVEKRVVIAPTPRDLADAVAPAGSDATPPADSSQSSVGEAR